MSKIGKAVIFDLDGVIINSQALYENSLRGFLRDIGISDIEFTTLVGMTTKGALSYISDTHLLPGSISDLAERFQKVYQESFKQSLSEEHLVAGVKPFIKRLADSQIRLAVASSAARPKIELVLSRFGLSRYFECTVSGYEVNASKPAPDVFIQSALKLNAKPSDCIVIEDSTHGIAGAKKAGMFCIGFRNPESENQDLSGADFILESFLKTEHIALHHGFIELLQNF